jgi:hypothetical protein
MARRDTVIPASPTGTALRSIKYNIGARNESDQPLPSGLIYPMTRLSQTDPTILSGFKSRFGSVR